MAAETRGVPKPKNMNGSFKASPDCNINRNNPEEKSKVAVTGKNNSKELHMHDEPPMYLKDQKPQGGVWAQDSILELDIAGLENMEKAPREILAQYLDLQLGEISSLILSLERLEKGLNNCSVPDEQYCPIASDHLNGNLHSKSHQDVSKHEIHTQSYDDLFQPISQKESVQLWKRAIGKGMLSDTECTSSASSSDEEFGRKRKKRRSERFVSLYAYSSDSDGSVKSDSCPPTPEDSIPDLEDLVTALNRIAGTPEQGVISFLKRRGGFSISDILHARASPSSLEACLQNHMENFQTSGLIMKMAEFDGNDNSIIVNSQENVELELDPGISQRNFIEIASDKKFDGRASMPMGPLLIKKENHITAETNIHYTIFNQIQEKQLNDNLDNDNDSVISVMGSISTSSSSLTSGVGDTSLSSPEEEMMVFEEAKEMGFVDLDENDQRCCNGKSCHDRSCTCRLSLTDEGIMSLASSQDLSSCRSPGGSMERAGMQWTSSGCSSLQSSKHQQSELDVSDNKKERKRFIDDQPEGSPSIRMNMSKTDPVVKSCCDQNLHEKLSHQCPSIQDTQGVPNCPPGGNKISGLARDVQDPPIKQHPEASDQVHHFLASQMEEADNLDKKDSLETASSLNSISHNGHKKEGLPTTSSTSPNTEKMTSNMEAEEKTRPRDVASPPMPKTGVLPPGRSTPIPGWSSGSSGKHCTSVSETCNGSNQVKMVSERGVSIPSGRLVALPPPGPRTSTASRKPTPAKPGLSATRMPAVPSIETKVSSSPAVELSLKQGASNRIGILVPPNRGPPGVWCELCNRRVAEFRKQGRLLIQQAATKGHTSKDPHLLACIEDQLDLPDALKLNLRHDQCTTCRTLVVELRREALAMVQSLDRGTATETAPNMAATYQHPSHQRAAQSGIPMFMGSRSLTPMPRTTPHYSLAHHRLARQGIPRGQPSGASAVKAHGDQKQHAWAASRKHYNQMLVSSSMMSAGLVRSNSPSVGMDSPGLVRGDYPMGGPISYNGVMPNGSMQSPSRPMALAVSTQHHSPGGGTPTGVLSPGSTGSGGSGASAAASFFARAAQKLNISSRKKRKPPAQDADPPPFPTNFNEIIRLSPPPAPPCLMRSVGRLQNPGTGKVKVMLRICPVEGNQPGTFLSTDPRKKQVTVYDPSHSGFATSAHRRQGAPPKMFAFDAVFSPDDSLAEICSSSLTEIIQAVVNGADGCLFCYGHARLGKTYTMIGMDDSPQNMGVIPCAVAWLFKLINENKEKTGARFSVRVSAVEVTGKQEKLKDLLADVANAQEAGGNTAPGVYLREDPICGTQLENQSELRAPTADRAAYYLDAAIAARTVPEIEEDARNSHLLFTLHVYQYRVEKGKTSGAALPQAVAGGRSRLHLIDLGSCSKSKDGNALSLSALGNVILALLNGQRHTPYRESKLTQLVRESLGNLSCRACMIAHVSPSLQAYNETLQVIQLAARIHRMRRRKNKFSSTSSEESSCDEGRLRPRMRVGVRMGTLREDALYSSGMSHSDPEYSSSSEQSCDTVIYLGRNGQALSDRELTDNEGPPSMVPIMPRTTPNFRRRPSGSRSSGDESSHSDSKLNSSQGERLGFTSPRHGATFTNTRLPGKSSSGRSTPTPSQSGSPSRSGSNQSGCASPSLGVVQLPRKLNVKSKHGKSKELGEPGSHERTAWSKGPYREGSVDKGKGGEKWVDGPSARSASEQWVDGPDVYQPQIAPGVPGHEQWIDGPSATTRTVPANAPPGYVQPWMENRTYKDAQGRIQPLGNLPMVSGSGSPGQKPGGEQWVDGPSASSKGNKKCASETWVDGPQEFRVDPCGPIQHPPKTERGKMWTEMPKPSPPPRGVSLTNKSSSCPPSATSSPKTSRPGQPLRNPVVAQVAGDRPVSQVSVDSSTSMNVNPDSRPVSMHSNEGGNTDPTQQQPPLCVEPKQGSKSFVRDWVEKHSFTAVETASNPEYGQHHRRGPKSVNEGKVRGTSPGSPNPGSSHSSPRIKKKLRRGALPPADSPRARTLAWVQSVQDAGGEAPTCPGQEDLSMAPECDQDMLSESQAPPPYDSCIEDTLIEDVDAQAERLASQESPKVKNKVWYTADEISHRSSPSITRKDGIDLDLSRDSAELEEGVPSTRESIYELEMDEQLEAMKMGSIGKSTFASEEDENSSNASYPCKILEKSLDEIELKIGEIIDIKEPVSKPKELPPTFVVHAEVEIQTTGHEHLSPQSSDDSEKQAGKKLRRPTCLRRPDGASNPNLSIDPESKPDMDLPESEQGLSSPEHQPKLGFTTSSPCHSTNSKAAMPDDESPIKRSVVGQSPEETSPTRTSKLPVKSSSSSKQSSKQSPSPSRTSILCKAFCRRSKSESKSDSPSKSKSDSPANSPAKSSSKPNSRVSSPKNVPVGGSRSASTSPTKCVNGSNKNHKEKNNRQKSTSPSPSSRASSVKSLPAKLASGPSTPIRMSSCPPTPSKVPSGKFKGFSSPTKSSSSSGKESKSSKESKTSSKSKSPSPNKKESKLPLCKAGNSRVTELTSRHSRITDSDSGNDSGIVKNEKKLKKLLSPYSLVTKPRAPSHSSSGHGSDNSSTFSHVHTSCSQSVKTPKTEASSGYESMIRDSEASGTSSSTQDSTSESSVGGRLHSSKILKKKSGSRRSRSAPARTCTDSPSSTRRHQSPSTPVRNGSKPASPSPRAWVDTRNLHNINDEPIEIETYDMDDVERLQRRRKEEAEMRALEKRRLRVKELLIQQEELKYQLAEAKDLLMIDRSTWSYDLYVAEQMDRDDPHYLEALEKETSILEKRVEACKSRIMLVTCFDVNV